MHALLYRRNPAAYTLERRDLVKEAAAGSSNSLWAIFENLAIFPGTKVRKLRKYLSSLVFALLACRDKKKMRSYFFWQWCGQGSVAEHYWDIGYHADADRCCR